MSEEVKVPTAYLQWNHSSGEYGPVVLEQLWVPRGSLNLTKDQMEEAGEWIEVPHYPA